MGHARSREARDGGHGPPYSIPACAEMTTSRRRTACRASTARRIWLRPVGQASCLSPRQARCLPHYSLFSHLPAEIRMMRLPRVFAGHPTVMGAGCLSPQVIGHIGDYFRNCCKRYFLRRLLVALNWYPLAVYEQKEVFLIIV